MQLLRNEKVINIMEKTLNHVDSRLIDHGKRVAYLIFKVLNGRQMFTEKELQNICILAMLHDVGAYKTEEIDQMVVFETEKVWEHSIYGYLFLKHFSPLKDFAPVICYHHAECNEIGGLSPQHQFLAQLISLCDRADVFSLQEDKGQGFCAHLEKYRDIKYRSDVIDMFNEAQIDIDKIFENIDNDAEFNRIFRETPLSREEASAYIDMIIFSIDFRSPQTVIHTVGTTYISGVIAELLGMSEEQVEIIKTGALLHDIGKIGVPVGILESPNRLADAEMDIMRKHVDFSEEILHDCVSEEIKQMVVKHHEKLDGSGYPRGIKAGEITMLDSIVAISDIFVALCQRRTYKEAYPKEKIFGILESMSGTLDGKILSLVEKNYEKLLDILDRETQPIVAVYNAVIEEYEHLMKEFVRS